MSDIAKMIAIAKRFGGGGSSGPSEVVILPETELVVDEITEGNGVYALLTPLENAPTAGAKCKLMWGGTEYTNTAVDVSAIIGVPVFLLGNTDLFAEDGMSLDNPDADAPYCIMLAPGGMPIGESGDVAYGMIMSQGITPDPPVLSIVQTEGASADSGSGGNGGGTCCITLEIEMAGVNDLTYTSKDKTYAAIKAACDAGALPYCKVNLNQDGTLAAVSIAHCMVIPHNESTGFVFRIVYGLGQGFAFSIQADDSVLVALD